MAKKIKKTMKAEEDVVITIDHVQQGSLIARDEASGLWTSTLDTGVVITNTLSPMDPRVISVRTKGQKKMDEYYPRVYDEWIIVDISAIMCTRIVYDLSHHPGEPYYKVSLMKILDTSFKGDAVYDVHACLRECMNEMFGSDSVSDVDEIIQSKCRIDFGDPNDQWKEIFLLFDRKSYAIVSGIPVDAPCI
jgi:hypothetical protein